MKQNKILHVNIPQPCSEDWDAMEKQVGGRHCAKCNYQVYDFSQLNDDELLQFFTQRPDVHCGRFHNTQLNRDILPSLTKKQFFIQRFNEIAAAVIAVISLKALPANAENKKTNAVEIFENKLKKNLPVTADSIHISGIIKDENGQPIAGAKVELEKTGTAFTNAEGRFNFEVEGAAGFASLLYFSYDSMVPVVRNYHAAMGNTTFNVVLVKYKGTASFSMGIMPPPWRAIGELPSLLFNKGETKLSVDNKAMLSAVAVRLKNYPGSKIMIKAFRGGHAPLQVFTSRLVNIKKYLVEKEGISADRITTSCEENGGDTHTVDILPLEENE